MLSAVLICGFSVWHSERCLQWWIGIILHVPCKGGPAMSSSAAGRTAYTQPPTCITAHEGPRRFLSSSRGSLTFTLTSSTDILMCTVGSQLPTSYTHMRRISSVLMIWHHISPLVAAPPVGKTLNRGKCTFTFSPCLELECSFGEV